MKTQLNPFQEDKSLSHSDSIVNSEAERSIQEVQAAMVIAKKFPRDSRDAMERILNACTRETLAESALYSFPKGNTVVTGPSIRLAEAIAQQWQNMQFGIRELSVKDGHSIVEAFAWDMESNTRQVKTFRVPHEKKVRGEIKKITDPREIYEHVANMGARRMRACILSVIPGDVVEAAIRQCEITQSQNIDVTKEAILEMLKTFEDEFNITQEMIEKRVGVRAESINAPQMINIRKIYVSLRDGMSKPWDFFEMEIPDDNRVTKKSDIASQINNGE